MDYFKTFIEFVTTFLVLHVLAFLPKRHVGSYSLTGDQTCTPCIRRRSPNHWATGEALGNGKISVMWGIDWRVGEQEWKWGCPQETRGVS